MENHSELITDKVTLMEWSYAYANPDGGYVGLDLGPHHQTQLTRIRFLPRLQSPHVMFGGKFQGSHTGQSDEYEDFYTIPTIPHIGWNEVVFNRPLFYRYIRYYGPSGSYCNISKLQFFGIRKGQFEETRLEGMPFGATPSPGREYTNVFREGPEVVLSFHKYSDQTGLPFISSSIPGPTVFLHQHDFLELLFIKSGSCFHLCNHQISCPFAGDLIIVPPATDHRYFGGSNLAITNIILYPNRLPDLFREQLAELPGLSCLFINEPHFQLGSSRTRSFHLFIDQQKKIFPLLDELELAFRQEHEFFKIESYALLFQLLVAASKFIKSRTTEEPGETETLRRHHPVTATITFLEQNFATIENIEEIHHEMQVSYSRLAHLLRKKPDCHYGNT